MQSNERGDGNINVVIKIYINFEKITILKIQWNSFQRAKN